MFFLPTLTDVENRASIYRSIFKFLMCNRALLHTWNVLDSHRTEMTLFAALRPKIKRHSLRRILSQVHAADFFPSKYLHMCVCMDIHRNRHCFEQCGLFMLSKCRSSCISCYF